MNIPYVQCELRNGDRALTAWVPRKLAQKGKAVRVKSSQPRDGGIDGPGGCVVGQDTEPWEYGWVVETVGGWVLTGEELDTVRDEYRFHRRRTDV